MNTKLAMLNGRIEAAEALRISPLCEGFQFGYGVFTTLRLIGGKPAMFDAHHARLSRQAASLGLEGTSSRSELRERCVRLAKEAGAVDAALRITLFRDLEGVGELIQLRVNSYGLEAYQRGMRLVRLNSEAGARLAELKTIAYLRFLTAKREAVARGYDEALLVSSEGYVLEGATTNLYAVFGGTVVTPPTSEGVLPGIVREALLAGRCGSKVEERRLAWDSMLGADEVFITNSLMGVMPVRSLGDDVHFRVPGRVTSEIAEAWTALEVASLE